MFGDQIIISLQFAHINQLIKHVEQTKQLKGCITARKGPELKLWFEPWGLSLWSLHVVLKFASASSIDSDFL